MRGVEVEKRQNRLNLAVVGQELMGGNGTRSLVSPLRSYSSTDQILRLNTVKAHFEEHQTLPRVLDTLNRKNVFNVSQKRKNNKIYFVSIWSFLSVDLARSDHNR
jgi:hypothetical protein